MKTVEESLKYSLHEIKEAKMQLLMESKLLCAIDHPNIVKAYETLHDNDHISLFIEHLDGQNLKQYLRIPSFQTCEAIATIMEQVFSALTYLHTRNIIYKNLQLETIIMEESDPYLGLKLVDMGVSEVQGRPSSIKGQVKTLAFTAPEVILEKNYDNKCDIWSAGVVLYILLFKELPFNGNISDPTPFTIFNKKSILFETQSSSDADSLAINLLQKLLERNVKQRYSALDALNDPFIQKYARKTQIHKYDAQLFKMYQDKTILELALSSVFVHNLMSKEEKIKLTKTFQALDLNRKGFLTFEEFEALQRTVNDEDQEYSAMSGSIEFGNITFTNFLILCADLNNKETLRKLFVFLDTDGNMNVQFAEVFDILNAYISEQVLEGIIQHFSSAPNTKVIARHFSFTYTN